MFSEKKPRDWNNVDYTIVVRIIATFKINWKGDYGRLLYADMKVCNVLLLIGYEKNCKCRGDGSTGLGLTEGAADDRLTLKNAHWCNAAHIW